MGKRSILWNGTAAVAIIGIMLAVAAPARGYSSDTCMKVVNNRSRTTSITVQGFNERNDWWSFAPGESAYLTVNGAPIRNASFTIFLYDGDGIDNSRGLEGNNRYVEWKFDPDSRFNGKCQDGSEVVTIHD